MANFQEAANFIALSVTPIKIASRDIGVVDAKIGTTIQTDTQTTMSPITQGTNYDRNPRGRGRGRGFFRGPNTYGRDGCGRKGKGRARMSQPRIPTSYNTPDQWSRLSPAQRAHVLNARGTKRNISALETAITDDFTSGPEYYDDDYIIDSNNYAFDSTEEPTL